MRYRRQAPHTSQKISFAAIALQSLSTTGTEARKVDGNIIEAIQEDGNRTEVVNDMNLEMVKCRVVDNEDNWIRLGRKAMLLGHETQSQEMEQESPLAQGLVGMFLIRRAALIGALLFHPPLLRAIFKIRFVQLPGFDFGPGQVVVTEF